MTIPRAGLENLSIAVSTFHVGLLQDLENFVQVFVMGFIIFGKDDDIVDMNETYFANMPMTHIVECALEYCWCVFQTEWESSELVFSMIY